MITVCEKSSQHYIKISVILNPIVPEYDKSVQFEARHPQIAYEGVNHQKGNGERYFM